MRNIGVSLIATPLLVTMLFVTAPRPVRADGELQAQLSGPDLNGAQPQGEAQYEADSDSAQFEMDVEDVNLDDGTQLNVNLNGTAFATVTVADQGVELDLETDNGDTVPTMQSGDVISLTDANGNTIASGTLASEDDQGDNNDNQGDNNDDQGDSQLSGHAFNGMQPSGVSTYHLHNSNEAFVLKAKNVDLPNGTQLNVNLNGSEFAVVTIHNHKAHIKLSTKKGDNLPTMHHGDIVSLTDANGNRILHGMYF